jgi:hypothetical protein
LLGLLVGYDLALDRLVVGRRLGLLCLGLEPRLLEIVLVVVLARDRVLERVAGGVG